MGGACCLQKTNDDLDMRTVRKDKKGDKGKITKNTFQALPVGK